MKKVKKNKIKKNKTVAQQLRRIMRGEGRRLLKDVKWRRNLNESKNICDWNSNQVFMDEKNE